MSDLIKGNQLMRSGQLEEAVAAYQKAIANHPNFHWSHHKLGEALEQLKRWTEAVEAYQNALELNSNSIWYHYKLGVVLIASGDLDCGIEVLKKGLKLNPSIHQYYQQLGNALTLREEWLEALENYKKAILINPNCENLKSRFLSALKKSKTNQDEPNYIDEINNSKTAIIFVFMPTFMHTISIYPSLYAFSRNHPNTKIVLLKTGPFCELIDKCLAYDFQEEYIGSCSVYRVGDIKDKLTAVFNPEIVLFTVIGVSYQSAYFGLTKNHENRINKLLKDCNIATKLRPLIASESVFLTGVWICQEAASHVENGYLSINTFIDKTAKQLVDKFHLNLITPCLCDLRRSRKTLSHIMGISFSSKLSTFSNNPLLITPRPWGSESEWKDGFYKCLNSYEGASSLVSSLLNKLFINNQNILIKEDFRSGDYLQILVKKIQKNLTNCHIETLGNLYKSSLEIPGLCMTPDLGTILMSGAFESVDNIDVYCYDSGTSFDLFGYFDGNFTAYIGAPKDLLENQKFSAECLGRMKTRCEWSIAEYNLAKTFGLLERKDTVYEPITINIDGYQDVRSFIFDENKVTEGLYIIKNRI